jgi:hypothetical protein
MTWLIAYITAHAIQIAAIGTTFYAIEQVEGVVINAEQIYKGAK